MSAQSRPIHCSRVTLVGMGRVILIITGGALLLAIWIYAILDAAQAESQKVRTLPKGVWVAITFLFPLVGSALWFWLGRPRKDKFGSFGAPLERPPVAPDDDPEYLRFLEARAKREREDRERQNRAAGRGDSEEHRDKDDDEQPDSGSQPGERP